MSGTHSGKLTELDHVGIAVRDLDAVVEWYEKMFGATVAHRERIETDGVEVPHGDAHVVELGELATAVCVTVAHQMSPLTDSGMSSAMRMMGMPVCVFWCISWKARPRSSKE